ncbi:hypothetical protein FEM48_Zijuj12G0167400 [Ziziphus jujuba var. spinosa]|uniref:Uncharacterized protein n=1 Tax=Ziziphus jujuba var. spinosa TaxID=714518 RepID=A0A978UEH0_ZIZJJ|nr:hypothetical protein FEM48_Zijuj12G0167400 [Ziziphus jujuba var. spinosa]
MAKPLEEKWCRNPEKVAEIYLVEASGKNTGTEQDKARKALLDTALISEVLLNVLWSLSFLVKAAINTAIKLPTVCGSDERRNNGENDI